MRYLTVGHRLPHIIGARLFGDRRRFGLVVQPEDPCWKEWQTVFSDLYYSSQKQSVGKIVNDAGYRVMERIDLAGKTMLEVGPGDISHIEHWSGRPARYVIADVREAMLEASGHRLAERRVRYESTLLERSDDGTLPYDAESFDIIVSFYALEHLYPFDHHLGGMLRVLKPGGLLVGAIPAEGGLSWGLGRFLTTRRWLKTRTTIDPDKLICWEHPNFADHILTSLDAVMHQRYLGFWPLGIPSVDLNLIIKFVYAKP